MTYDIAWKVKNEIPMGSGMKGTSKPTPPTLSMTPRTNVRYLATKRIRTFAVTATAKSAFARADRDSALDTPRATNQLTKMERIITKTKRG